jgi:putative ABC transport system permease protein
MNFWTLGLKNAWRDWRAGELRLLVVAVTLAVAALTAVGFFADRLQGGLERDARQLLGGDVVLSSDRPSPPAFHEQARSLGLGVTRSVSFPTMARTRDEEGGQSKLVSFKAVESGYPLRGRLRLSEGPGLPEQVAQGVPGPGEAWVDPGLLDALDLRMGQTLLLGDHAFKLTRLIIQEPDRGGGFMSFSPRVMVNQADVAATGLVQPASRLNYRLAVAGSDAQVKRFTQWVQAEMARQDVRGLRLESMDSGRPEMRQTLDRAGKFLSLVALVKSCMSRVALRPFFGGGGSAAFEPFALRCCSGDGGECSQPSIA